MVRQIVYRERCKREYNLYKRGMKESVCEMSSCGNKNYLVFNYVRVFTVSFD